MTITLNMDGDTLVLKNPDYGDSLGYDSNFMIGLAMDGTIYSYRRKNRQTITLPFNNMTTTETQGLVAFYTSYSGSLFTYTDPLGTVWKSRFKNNPLETICNLGEGSCSLYSFTLQFRSLTEQ